MMNIKLNNIYNMGVIAVAVLLSLPAMAGKQDSLTQHGISPVLKYNVPEIQNGIENGKANENGMTFDYYISKVGSQNLQYLAERLNIDIAEAEVVAAKVLQDPSLDFEGSKETYSLGLSYTLELGKRHARTRLARSEREMEKLNFMAAYQELRAQAAELFLDAMLQKNLLDVKRASYDYMEKFSQSDSLRFRIGEITENDARQSHLEAVSLLNEVFEQEAAYHSSLVELNRFMGSDSDTLQVPLGNWETLERDFNLSDLLAAGMLNRIEISASTQNVEVNRRAYGLERAERRPDIGLSLSYEREWHCFAPEARFATVGVSIPLSFSLANKGALRSAKLKIEQAEYQQKDIQLQVRSDIRQAWCVYESALKKVQQYKSDVLDDARKVMEGMVFSYQRGDSSVLDVLISQRSYNEVCQDYLETMKGYVSSLVQLEKSCGIWDIHF